MSKKVSILLSDSQHAAIKKLAEKEGLTITDYIINKLPVEAENKITLTDVKKRIKKTKLQEFTLPQLYEKQHWSSFQKGSKLTIGRRFYKAVLNGEIENIIFKGRNSSHAAVYINTIIQKTIDTTVNEKDAMNITKEITYKE